MLGFDQMLSKWSPLVRSRVAEKMMSRVGLGIFYGIEAEEAEAKGYG